MKFAKIYHFFHRFFLIISIEKIIYVFLCQLKKNVYFCYLERFQIEKMNLADLKENQKAVITHCRDRDLPLKLIEMGCVEGAEIVFVNRATFGTPYYFIIDSTRIALGKEIVSEIEVKLIDDAK